MNETHLIPEELKKILEKQYQDYILRPEQSAEKIRQIENVFLLHDGTVSVGFENFRKFGQLPLTPLRPITLFVGGNNSGKSTLVKGLLLLLDNLHTLSMGHNALSSALTPLFRLDAKDIHDVNISTFARALYNKATKEEISFRLKWYAFDITLVVRGKRESLQTASPIASVQIVDEDRQLTFLVDFAHDKATLTVGEQQVEMPLAQSVPSVDENVLPVYMKSFADTSLLKENDAQVLTDNYLNIRESAYLFERLMQSLRMEYIHAHAATQNILYNTADKNDYMAQTIHNYVLQFADADTQEREWVKHWMKVLQMGVDFKITNIGGEAYTLQTLSEDGDEEYLADKGIGSNQMMILLLRVATVASRYAKARIKPLIVVEEPEQNLHPALQSKLSDLFYEVYQKYGLKFLVETHSEYLIRRSQVIVSQDFSTPEGLEKNPFVVYYFPESELPYDMKYTESGRFEEKFGEGFYDAAGALHLQLPRLERRK